MFYKVCENGYDGIVKLLLSYGVNVNLCKENGKIVLYVVIVYGYKMIVEILFYNGVIINVCKKDGESLCYKLCENMI